ncbi:MAG: serine hydrolase, partial [Candidatus Helarchaeota archaeon]
ILACGGELDGVRLFSAATVEKALEEQYYGKDKVIRTPIRYGVGFGLPSKTVPLPNPRSLYWGGFGGSIAFMDLDAKVSCGYAMNKMIMETQGDIRSERFRNALYEAYNEL